MFTLKVESTTGNILTLTQDENRFQVVNVDGLNPPKAAINSSIVAGMDGSKFKSSRLLERNIVITLRLNGSVEKNRLYLYKYFRTKQWCKIYFKNESRDVYIEGYVETIDCDLFSQSEIMQISIICQDPYFKAMKEIVDDISKTIKMFEFPFAFGSNGATHGGDPLTDDAKEFSTYDYDRLAEVVNLSEVSTGMIIEISFTGTTIDPTLKDAITGETLKVLGEYRTGDVIVINTNKGSKNIYLQRGAVRTNIFSRLQFGSTWFQLRVGYNYYQYFAKRGDAYMTVTFSHHELFEGV